MSVKRNVGFVGLVLAIVLLGTACTGSASIGRSQASPTPSVAPSVEPSPVPGGSPQPGEQAPQEQAVPLQPGAHTTRSFSPQFTYSTAAGGQWFLLTDVPASFWLVHGVGSATAQIPQTVNVGTLSQVYDPSRSIVSEPPRGLDPAGPPLLPAPEDLLAWLGDHPGLRAGVRRPVTVGGTRGSALELTATETVLFTYLPGLGSIYFQKGERDRVIVLDQGDQQLMVDFSSSVAQFPAFAPIAQALVDSMRFRVTT